MYRGLGGLDIKLEKILGESFFKKCFYIELGANDGVSQSNTFFIEKKYKQFGLLIEPIPEIFTKLKKNRSCKNIFVQKVITNFENHETKSKLLYTKHNNGLMSVNLSDENSFFCNEIQEFQNGTLGEKWSSRKNGIVISELESSSLQSILDDNNIRKVDLFILDVEGSESSVLNGIDFNKTEFEYILIETKNLTKIQEILNNKFILTNKLSKHDYLFKKK